VRRLRMTSLTTLLLGTIPPYGMFWP
jgi:hypothetical protein